MPDPDENKRVSDFISNIRQNGKYVGSNSDTSKLPSKDDIYTRFNNTQSKAAAGESKNDTPAPNTVSSPKSVPGYNTAPDTQAKVNAIEERMHLSRPIMGMAVPDSNLTPEQQENAKQVNKPFGNNINVGMGQTGNDIANGTYGVMRQFNNGLGFGILPRAQAALAALPYSVINGTDFGDTYNNMRDMQREGNIQYGHDNSTLNMLARGAGSLYGGNKLIGALSGTKVGGQVADALQPTIFNTTTRAGNVAQLASNTAKVAAPGLAFTAANSVTDADRPGTPIANLKEDFSNPYTYILPGLLGGGSALFNRYVLGKSGVTPNNVEDLSGSNNPARQMTNMGINPKVNYSTEGGLVGNVQNKIDPRDINAMVNPVAKAAGFEDGSYVSKNAMRNTQKLHDETMSPDDPNSMVVDQNRKLLSAIIGPGNTIKPNENTLSILANGITDRNGNTIVPPNSTISQYAQQIADNLSPEQKEKWWSKIAGLPLGIIGAGGEMAANYFGHTSGMQPLLAGVLGAGISSAGKASAGGASSIVKMINNNPTIATLAAEGRGVNPWNLGYSGASSVPEATQMPSYIRQQPYLEDQ